MGKSIFKEKRELYVQWSRIKDIADSEKMKFDEYRELMDKEKILYEKWKFLDNFTKAKEKVENEKKKKI